MAGSLSVRERRPDCPVFTWRTGLRNHHGTAVSYEVGHEVQKWVSDISYNTYLSLYIINYIDDPPWPWSYSSSLMNQHEPTLRTNRGPTLYNWPWSWELKGTRPFAFSGAVIWYIFGNKNNKYYRIGRAKIILIRISYLPFPGPPQLGIQLWISADPSAERPDPVPQHRLERSGARDIRRKEPHVVPAWALAEQVDGWILVYCSGIRMPVIIKQYQTISNDKKHIFRILLEMMLGCLFVRTPENNAYVCMSVCMHGTFTFGEGL